MVRMRPLVKGSKERDFKREGLMQEILYMVRGYCGLYMLQMLPKPASTPIKVRPHDTYRVGATS